MNPDAGHNMIKRGAFRNPVYSLLGVIFLALPAMAWSAGMQLSPATGSYSVGDDIIVTLFADSEGSDIVVADASIEFDPAVLELNGVDLTESGFAYDFGFSSPEIFPVREIDNDNGRARILVALPGPGVNGSQIIIARLTFRSLAASTGTDIIINYPGAVAARASKLIIDDGLGTDALSSVVSARYVLNEFLDTDGDGIYDDRDNCTLKRNPDQRDTDSDGYGNYCDADFNNDRIVNAIDLALFRQGFLSDDPLRDINSDGIVNAVDLALFKKLFLRPPGPSGLVN